MTPQNEITIRLKGVSKSFGETRALRSVDFEARAGEVHAIVGENGSGKSTMAKIMSGVLLPDQGDVEILGRRPRNPIEACDAGLATIFQEVLVADEASILDNLYVGRDRLLGLKQSRADRVGEAAALMQRFAGEPVDLGAQVGSLPLSMKQWIVIARAILRRPKILILDESSAALDLAATVRLHEAINDLRNAGSTILIVTHRIAELVRIADRATILRDGEVVGMIGKQDITEENLLAMMTPADRHVAVSKEVVRLPRKGAVPPVIQADTLRLSAGSPDFSFSIEPGQIVGITGLDGQGHDAFVRVLAGIAAPASGMPKVRTPAGVEVLDCLAAAEKLGVAYVSGDRKREGIFPDQSIFENLAIGAYSQNLSSLGIIRRSSLGQMFQQEVSRFRIKIGRPSNKITSLSGGNQQKILIGRAFARRPKVIVLNDPARGVDLGTKRDLYAELRLFADQGGAVIYLSSEIEEFLGFADRVDVFVGNTIFRSLKGNMLDEDEILAAMFGQDRSQHVSFVAKDVAS
ncbi:MAG: sugar ABC transporter ATP-binding protein [Mesorhizobium sp.]|uniref:sugar ABC transporter ATP-binding protein n=1 Tax=Mesorhizobium sp. TaxID=1871066 RepID=UPI001ACD87A3|nr:sugar ABC transporter ATP-binding protein [Mesorhizobium sp.]MBN9217283.1 sugar ABC transporter ATP-binding protein [Mesorhizobium sp.]